jgi:hypothetical protein
VHADEVVVFAGVGLGKGLGWYQVQFVCWDVEDEIFGCGGEDMAVVREVVWMVLGDILAEIL